MNVITIEVDGSVSENHQRLDSDPLEYLGYQTKLAQGATLRTFFVMMETYPLLTRLNPFLPTYLRHYQSCAEKDCTYPGMDRLELNKTVEMIGFPGEPRLEIYITLHGVGVDENQENKDENIKTMDLKNIGLDSLLDVPLTLGKLKHVVMGDKVDIFEFETVFSFFEFIDGIVWELSFLGTLTGCPLRR